MKKLNLAILSIVGLLTLISCGPTQESTNVDPSTNIPETSDEITESIDNTKSSEENSSSTENQEILTTTIVDLKNIPGISAGTNFNQQVTPEQQALFISHFNASDEGLLSYFKVKENTNVTMNADTNKEGVEPTTYVTVGSKKNIGQIDFYFTRPIKSVKILAKSYYKTYDSYEGDPNNGVSYDENVLMNVSVKDQKVGELALNANPGQVPESQEIEIKFSTPTTTFGIFNMGPKSRIYLDTFYISY